MPIYEYRCSSCGFQKEYLQKVTDPLLTSCPECNKETFKKMVTAAGFQLKGTGWYATDFKGPVKPKTDAAKTGNGEAAKTASAKADSGSTSAAGTSGASSGSTAESHG